MKFLNDRCKRCKDKDCANCVKWYTRDWFFAGTLLFIVLCVVIYAFAPSWQTNLNESSDNWDKPLYFWSLLRSFANAFNHLSWQHVLLNMLVFFVCGLYLERKTGTLYFIVIVLGLGFFTSMAITANNLSAGWAGFSGINYGLFAYVIINYIFSFKKSRRNTTNIVLGAITIFFVYLFMCFKKDDISQVSSMTWYPHDLIYNLGHYTGFLTGIVFGCIIHFTRYLVKKETRDKDRKKMHQELRDKLNASVENKDDKKIVKNQNDIKNDIPNQNDKPE